MFGVVIFMVGMQLKISESGKIPIEMNKIY
jgi:hypothetical protein